MLNDKRFIKFKFEKQSDNNKFKDNEINIVFYSEKNILLSDNFNSQRDLLNLFKKIIINESSNTILVRSEKGSFLLVKRKTSDKDLTYKYLEELGGRIYNKIKPLGSSQAKIYENNISINERLALGILLSSYKFENYKKNKIKQITNLKNVVFVCNEPNKNLNKISEIQNLAKGVFTARDLVWQPPNILYPSSFADECKKLKKIGVKVTIYNEKQLQKIGMDALLAVGRGSRKDSQVVVMEWSGGKKNSKPMAFIGKGVCFDSGGLSRDGLMTGVSKKYKRPISLVRFSIEFFVVFVGWLLGGTLGIGTIIFAVFIGPFVALSLKIVSLLKK